MFSISSRMNSRQSKLLIIVDEKAFFHYLDAYTRMVRKNGPLRKRWDFCVPCRHSEASLSHMIPSSSERRRIFTLSRDFNKNSFDVSSIKVFWRAWKQQTGQHWGRFILFHSEWIFAPCGLTLIIGWIGACCYRTGFFQEGSHCLVITLFESHFHCNSQGKYILVYGILWYISG